MTFIMLFIEDNSHNIYFYKMWTLMCVCEGVVVKIT